MRGHSNVYASQTVLYPANPTSAMVPLVGGASVHTVRNLPPLALDREEWETIGRRMGWLNSDQSKPAANLSNVNHVGQPPVNRSMAS